MGPKGENTFLPSTGSRDAFFASNNVQPKLSNASFIPPQKEESGHLGDGHDLTSPRFAGDPKLEAAFDNKHLIRFGSKGSHVRKIQKALEDSGHPLLQFGVDGIFGQETMSAVKGYQTKNTLAVDGIVGPETMGHLDKKFAGSEPPTTIDTICDLLHSLGIPMKEDPNSFAMNEQPEKVKRSLTEQPEVSGNLGNVITCQTPPANKNTKGCKKPNGDLLCEIDGCKKPKAVLDKPDISLLLCDDKVARGAPNFVVLPGCGSVAGGKGGSVQFRAGTWQIGPGNTNSCACGKDDAEMEKNRKKWDWGFSQTVESASYGAKYTQGRFGSTGISNASRDALVGQGTPTAPWFGAPGSGFGPQNVNGFSPQIVDTPHANFKTEHPKDPKSKLNEVCLSGKFNVFFVVAPAGATPSTSNIEFMYHWTIEIDATFSLKKGRDGCSKAGWNKSKGKPKVTARGPGDGSKTFIFDQPIANIKGSKINYSTSKDPCDQ